MKKITLLMLYTVVVSIFTVLLVENITSIKVKEVKNSKIKKLQTRPPELSQSCESKEVVPSTSEEPTEPLLSSDNRSSDDVPLDNLAPFENALESAEQVEVTTEPLKQVIVVGGVHYYYKDTGQATGQDWIDQDPTANVGTWGGQAVNSVSDNLSTHFIGHNPTVFYFVTQLLVGHQFEVYDATGQGKVYTVMRLLDVDINAISKDGQNHWSAITGAGNKEQVVLQTCLENGYNRIVFAE
ncbi:sortase domain-containing protein [Pseudolactococcus reticulitermitis]|uniref:Sortase n=1 Tax=Pseudolactococcus reticulitermitis TaxID=2025039 RepID=A0A224X9U6_9LACT|nr:sortase [Lactococcus reticulitermitis]GAX46505.1 hypothetical protein RsY01_84 [Lactococcus reticulitermitis]